MFEGHVCGERKGVLEKRGKGMDEPGISQDRCERSFLYICISCSGFLSRRYCARPAPSKCCIIMITTTVTCLHRTEEGPFQLKRYQAAQAF